jgi:glycosyltransferase involved in cell wall biosynthesis
MRIAIAGLLGTTGGPRSYALNLIKNILSIDRANDYFIFSDTLRPLEDIEGAEKIQIGLASAYTRFLWDHLKVPINLKRYGIELYHNTKNVLPQWCSGKLIVTIHDLSPFIFPHTFTRLQGLYLRFHLSRSVKRADRVITDSANSKKDIFEILRADRGKVVDIPLGVSPQFRKSGDEGRLARLREKYGLKPRQILFVGTIQPRKNLGDLLEAFGRLKRLKEVPHQLVIVGRKGWLSRDLRKSQAKERDLRFVGEVPDEELPLFYQGAELFVSPSSYEGFGLTCLESMVSGTPVVAYRSSSLPEVVGDAGIMVEPGDKEALAQAILNIISKEGLRNELIEKGLKRARQFSWEATARATLRVYQEVLEG